MQFTTLIAKELTFKVNNLFMMKVVNLVMQLTQPDCTSNSSEALIVDAQSDFEDDQCVFCTCNLN